LIINTALNSNKSEYDGKYIYISQDAKKILTASNLENWRRQPGCHHTTWMKTIQQDLKSNNLSLDEAIDQNHSLWNTDYAMSTFSATHSYCCTPEMNE